MLSTTWDQAQMQLVARVNNCRVASPMRSGASAEYLEAAPFNACVATTRLINGSDRTEDTGVGRHHILGEV